MKINIKNLLLSFMTFFMFAYPSAKASMSYDCGKLIRNYKAKVSRIIFSNQLLEQSLKNDYQELVNVLNDNESTYDEVVSSVSNLSLSVSSSYRTSSTERGLSEIALSNAEFFTKFDNKNCGK